MIAEHELKRYQRQLQINGWGAASQERLKQARVFVAGAGGLGSPLLMYLAVAGVGTIHVCDFDRIEISNLNRQILHNDRKIGMPKADSAKAMLNELNPFTEIIPVKNTLTAKNAGSLVGNSDLIVDCLDNFKTRHILNRISVGRGIPMLHAGVSGLQGQITFLHPPETPCLSCFYPASPKKQVFPILGATAGVLGTLQAMEALKYLSGIGENLKNRLLFFDGQDMKFETIKISRNPRCAVCGKKQVTFKKTNPGRGK